MIEQVCGPVFFDQLSKPVGYTNQDIIDKINESTYMGGELDFPKEKRGEPIIDHEDPRRDRILHRMDVMKKLYCYCLNRTLFDADNEIDNKSIIE